MEAVQPRVQPRYVLRPLGPPVMEAGLQRHAVRQAVSDGEASATLELGQNDDHLSAENTRSPAGILYQVFHVYLCRGGTLSTVLSSPRVDTTL